MTVDSEYPWERHSIFKHPLRVIPSINFTAGYQIEFLYNGTPYLVPEHSHNVEFLIELNETVTSIVHEDHAIDLVGGEQEITLLGPTFTYLPD